MKNSEEYVSDVDDSISYQKLKFASPLKPNHIAEQSVPTHFASQESIPSSHHSSFHNMKSFVPIPHLPHHPRSLSPTDNLMSPTSMRVHQLHHKKLIRTDSECSHSTIHSYNTINTDNDIDDHNNIIKDFSLKNNLTSCDFPLVDGIPLILGSSSSSRKEVLELLNWPFTTMSPDIDEKAIRSTNHMELPQLIAKAKANALIKRLKEDNVEGPLVLITADQIVVYKDTLREKPESVDEAREYLTSYSNDCVTTCSAIVVTHYPSERQACDLDIATVYWKIISSQVVDDVIARGNIFSSAGGFRIEDPDLSGLILNIDGAVDSVVGMPVETTVRLIGRVVEEKDFRFGLVGNVVTFKTLSLESEACEFNDDGESNNNSSNNNNIHNNNGHNYGSRSRSGSGTDSNNNFDSNLWQGVIGNNITMETTDLTIDKHHPIFTDRRRRAHSSHTHSRLQSPMHSQLHSPLHSRFHSPLRTHLSLTANANSNHNRSFTSNVTNVTSGSSGSSGSNGVSTGGVGVRSRSETVDSIHSRSSSRHRAHTNGGTGGRDTGGNSGNSSVYGGNNNNNNMNQSGHSNYNNTNNNHYSSNKSEHNCGYTSASEMSWHSTLTLTVPPLTIPQPPTVHSPSDHMLSPVSMKIARKKSHSSYKSMSKTHVKRKEYSLQTDVTRRPYPLNTHNNHHNNSLHSSNYSRMNTPSKSQQQQQQQQGLHVSSDAHTAINIPPTASTTTEAAPISTTTSANTTPSITATTTRLILGTDPTTKCEVLDILNWHYIVMNNTSANGNNDVDGRSNDNNDNNNIKDSNNSNSKQLGEQQQQLQPTALTSVDLLPLPSTSSSHSSSLSSSSSHPAVANIISIPKPLTHTHIHTHTFSTEKVLSPMMTHTMSIIDNDNIEDNESSTIGDINNITTNNLDACAVSGTRNEKSHVKLTVDVSVATESSYDNYYGSNKNKHSNDEDGADYNNNNTNNSNLFNSMNPVILPSRSIHNSNTSADSGVGSAVSAMSSAVSNGDENNINNSGISNASASVATTNSNNGNVNSNNNTNNINNYTNNSGGSIINHIGSSSDPAEVAETIAKQQAECILNQLKQKADTRAKKAATTDITIVKSITQATTSTDKSDIAATVYDSNNAANIVVTTTSPTIKHEKEDEEIITDAIIITTHQIAIFNNHTLRHFPLTETEARMFLTSYSNHSVTTLTSVIATHYPSERQACDTDIATVYFREINEDVIDAVVKRPEIYKCVGGFRVDDVDLNPLIQHIEGTIDSLVGMPVDTLVRAIQHVSTPISVVNNNSGSINGNSEHKSTTNIGDTIDVTNSSSNNDIINSSITSPSTEMLNIPILTTGEIHSDTPNNKSNNKATTSANLLSHWEKGQYNNNNKLLHSVYTVSITTPSTASSGTASPTRTHTGHPLTPNGSHSMSHTVAQGHNTVHPHGMSSLISGNNNNTSNNYYQYTDSPTSADSTTATSNTDDGTTTTNTPTAKVKITTQPSPAAASTTTTKWLKVLCPGKKLTIRSSPTSTTTNTTANAQSLFNNSNSDSSTNSYSDSTKNCSNKSNDNNSSKSNHNTSSNITGYLSSGDVIQVYTQMAASECYYRLADNSGYVNANISRVQFIEVSAPAVTLSP